MKPRRNASIDGFVPRRPQGGSMDNFERRQTSITANDELPKPVEREPVIRDDVTESLQGIEDTPEEPVKKRRFRLFGRRRDRAKKQRTKFQKWRRRIIWALVIILVIVLGYFGYRVISSMLKLTHGNLLSLVTPGTPLKTDGQGRTNILVFGTSQDDAAHRNAVGGGGLWLTDSIMLVSMNQKTHVVKTVSIPRDLWVNMPDSCASGFAYQEKINAVYSCANGLSSQDASAQKSSDYAKKDKQGAEALEATVKNVTGITPQYYVHVNYTVLKQSVDAVGGIKVNIKGDGADGIYDTNFDWDCPNGPYTCKNVYYPHDGEYTLNGKQALNLSRARADTGAYSYKDFGLARGDFDRQLNQQKVLDALKTKAMSAGTLTNPIKLTNLLDALGNNITTDLEAGNYKTLIDYAKKMPSKNGMQSIDLNKEGEAVVKTGNVGSASVVLATSGVLDYTSIIDYLAKQLSANPAVAENASIAVYNASGSAGAAADLESKLSEGGLNVVSTGNADQTTAGTSKYTIYDSTSGDKPQTIKYLKSNLTGAQVSTHAVPAQLAGSADIIIVIGSGAESSSTN